MMPVVPPAINALCQVAAAGTFPNNHRVRWVKSGAAPLAPELARRLTDLTGIIVNQGYGMTEASPVTHVGYVTPPAMNRPASIGQPLALTECRILNLNDQEVGPGEAGELVMRGPQFMLGYWKEPQATAAVLARWLVLLGRYRAHRRGWLLLCARPAERDDQVQGIPGRARGSRICTARTSGGARLRRGRETRCQCGRNSLRVCYLAMVSRRRKLGKELCTFVADRLAHHKQPREIHFVDAVPRTPSGKILRRELRGHVS